MKIQIDREKKIILLKWLQQGYIETLDLPELVKNDSLFYEMLMQTGTVEDEDDTQHKS